MQWIGIIVAPRTNRADGIQLTLYRLGAAVKDQLKLYSNNIRKWVECVMSRGRAGDELAAKSVFPHLQFC